MINGDKENKKKIVLHKNCEAHWKTLEPGPGFRLNHWKTRMK